MAAGTRRGFKHGAEKPKNEDGGTLIEGPPKKILILDGMSSGRKGALAVEQALQVMTHHAKKGEKPFKVMQYGTQKLASVRRKFDLDKDQDGATACLVSDERNRIEYAVVGDAKVRIFDVTAGMLVDSSGEHSIVGDVEIALGGVDSAQTVDALQSAVDEGVYFQAATHDRLQRVIDKQDAGEEIPIALQRLIGNKVRREVRKNKITASINPTGDLDKPPLTRTFQKQPGHTYLVLAHSDGLILEEGEIEELLKRANGKPLFAVRLLKQGNEFATTGERTKTREVKPGVTEPSGYIDDCTVAAMAA